MNPDDLKRIFRDAVTAVMKGADPRAINEDIASITDGQFTSLEQIRQNLSVDAGQLRQGITADAQPPVAAPEGDGGGGVSKALLRAFLASSPLAGATATPQPSPPPPTEEEIAAAQSRLSAGGGNAVGDFMLQGPAGLFADEFASLTQGRDAGAALKQRQEDLSLLAPGASAASQAAGLVIPAAGASQAMSMAKAAGATPGFVGAVGGGTASGLASLFSSLGGGEGSVTERLADAIIPTATGTALGTVTGGLLGRVGSASGRTASGRTGRVARGMRDGAKVSDGVFALHNEVKRNIQRVRNRFFKPLDRAYPTVNDPQINGLIERIRRHDDVRTVLPRTVRSGRRAPSFSELNKIRIKLEKSIDGPRADFGEDLRDLMEESFPRFRQANAAFREAKGVEEALKAGRAAYQQPIGNVQIAMQELSSDGARDMFRRGQLAEALQRIEMKETGATGTLRNMLDAGPSLRPTLVKMFPDESAGEEFLRLLRVERDADVINSAFRSLGGSLLRFTALGVAAGVSSGLFGSGN